MYDAGLYNSVLLHTFTFVSAGYESITSIDISDVVIGQMQRIYKDKPKMQCVALPQ